MAYNLKCLYFNRILIASLVRNLLKYYVLNFKNNGNSEFEIHNKFSRERVVKEKLHFTKNNITRILSILKNIIILLELKTVFLNFSGMLGIK